MADIPVVQSIIGAVLHDRAGNPISSVLMAGIRRLEVNATTSPSSGVPNRPGFRVAKWEAGNGVEQAGPNVPVPDGFAVYLEADEANTVSVQVGGTGESAVAATAKTLAPGFAFPVAIFVQNLNQVGATAGAAGQNIRYIVEKV